jgi:integrase
MMPGSCWHKRLILASIGRLRKPRKSNDPRTVLKPWAREWFARYAPSCAATHSDKIIKRLESDVFPWIGGRPIADVKPPEVLKLLHRIEGRGAHDTAHRALQNCGQVFRYGVAAGRLSSDPCRDLRGALRPLSHEHFAAITEPAAVGQLRAIDGFKGTLTV